MRYILGDYKKRPEPGRCLSREVQHTITERIVEKQSPQPIDIAALANAVAKAININIQVRDGEIVKDDMFDNSKTMSKIADQMIVQRGNNETNFDSLGKVKEVHKNSEETDKTIDLLSGLD